MASARTKQLCPAVSAFFFGKDIVTHELVAHFIVMDTGKHIADYKFILSNKLVAGIQISFGGHSQVFVPGSAGGHPFE